MKLAKPHLDVGLYTNAREAMLAFWQQEIGLPFEGLLKLGGGFHQLRHTLNCSVLKINHSRSPLPDAPRAGYRELVIAREGVATAQRRTDPDGNAVTIVPPGHDGVDSLAIRMAVRSVDAHRRFYADVLGLPEAGPDSFRCGDTLLTLCEDPDANADVASVGVGLRYLTVQVYDVDAEHAAICAAGGQEGRPPVTLGTTARVSFVRDPDGNWIELSQRASLTGSVEGSGAR